MHVPARLFTHSLILAACVMLAAGSNSLAEEQGPAPTMDTLVSAAWLEEHLGDPDLVILDCTVVVEPDGSGGMRSVNGRASHDSGHIPTAGFADLLGALSDRDSPFPFTAPSPEAFAAAMEQLGVSDDSRVVLYDTDVAVYDGSLREWTADPGNPMEVDLEATDAED